MKYTKRDEFNLIEDALNSSYREKNIAEKTAQCYNEIRQRVDHEISLGKSIIDAVSTVLNSRALREHYYPQLKNSDVRTKLKQLLLNHYKSQGMSFAKREQEQSGGHDER